MAGVGQTWVGGLRSSQESRSRLISHVACVGPTCPRLSPPLSHRTAQSAVDAGAISARAKPAAAAEKAKELQAALKARGCVETFTPDPELLQEGQVGGVLVTVMVLVCEQRPTASQQLCGCVWR